MKKRIMPLSKSFIQAGVEIILPFNDDFIIEIDDDLKTIEFNAPRRIN
jgi:hypothetical protein